MGQNCFNNCCVCQIFISFNLSYGTGGRTSNVFYGRVLYVRKLTILRWVGRRSPTYLHTPGRFIPFLNSPIVNSDTMVS